MRYGFIEAEKANHPIALMCRCLKVSRSGFYAWRRRGPSARRQADRRLAGAIRGIHQRSRGTYGSPRIHAELQVEGQRVARKRVARIMREEGLAGRRPRRWRRTTDSSHAHPVAENVLDRRFEAGGGETWWVGDVTYVATLEGWLYLAVLLDVATRRVVGWSMSTRNDTQLVLSALEMALGGGAGEPPVGHHSDRGSTYASAEYRRVLEARGITCSMSRRGDCWDNAIPESFFSTLKVEWLYRLGLMTREETRSMIFDFIEVFYNRQRRHSALGYLSPEEYAGLARAS